MTEKITSTKKSNLNKMNRAAKDVNLGTMLEGLGTVATGSYTTILADISGSSLTIWTSASPIGGGIVAATRSGSSLASTSIKYLFSGSGITVSSASAAAVPLAVGDVISYVVFK